MIVMGNYLDDQLLLLKRSFLELDLRFFLVVIFDILIAAAVFFASWLWMLFIKSKGQVVSELPLGQLMQMKLPELEGTLGVLRTFFFVLVGSIILLLLIYIALWSLFKGLQWSIVLKKKFSAKYYGKFLLLNIIWIVIWSIPFSIAAKMRSSVGLKAVYFAAVILVYFTCILYIIFTEDNKFKNILSAFSIGFRKFYFFAAPFSIAAVIGYFVFYMNNIFSFLPRSTVLVIFSATGLLFLSWSRYYLAKVVKFENK